MCMDDDTRRFVAGQWTLRWLIGAVLTFLGMCIFAASYTGTEEAKNPQTRLIKDYLHAINNINDNSMKAELKARAIIEYSDLLKKVVDQPLDKGKDTE